MTYRLFLDDKRDPPNDGRPWVVARSVAEAIDTCLAQGAPAHISFDHDLGDGVDAPPFVHWLIESDMDANGAFLSARFTYAIHSGNPVGVGNIDGLLRGYLGGRELDLAPPAGAFVTSRVRDSLGNLLLVAHGGRWPIVAFDRSESVDGGFHFGDQEQARMRTSPNGTLTLGWLDIRKPRRSKDAGGQWRSKIAAAKADGYDGIVYLNRYEGIPGGRIEALAKAGMLEKLDTMPDARFKQYVPEARDSYIAFAPEQIIVAGYLPVLPRRVITFDEPTRRNSRPTA